MHQIWCDIQMQQTTGREQHTVKIQSVTTSRDYRRLAALGNQCCGAFRDSILLARLNHTNQAECTAHQNHAERQ